MRALRDSRPCRRHPSVRTAGDRDGSWTRGTAPQRGDSGAIRLVGSQHEFAVRSDQLGRPASSRARVRWFVQFGIGDLVDRPYDLFSQNRPSGRLVSRVPGRAFVTGKTPVRRLRWVVVSFRTRRVSWSTKLASSTTWNGPAIGVACRSTVMLLWMSSDTGEELLDGRGEFVVVIESAFELRDLDRRDADGVCDVGKGEPGGCSPIAQRNARADVGRRVADHVVDLSCDEALQAAHDGLPRGWRGSCTRISSTADEEVIVQRTGDTGHDLLHGVRCRVAIRASGGGPSTIPARTSTGRTRARTQMSSGTGEQGHRRLDDLDDASIVAERVGTATDAGDTASLTPAVTKRASIASTEATERASHAVASPRRSRTAVATPTRSPWWCSMQARTSSSVGLRTMRDRSPHEYSSTDCPAASARHRRPAWTSSDTSRINTSGVCRHAARNRTVRQTEDARAATRRGT